MSTATFLHDIPADLNKILKNNSGLKKLWDSLTPLSQNEWICWITIVKKEETRLEHLKKFQEDLQRGKRRPCCWPGCPHRRESAKKWLGKI